jgi:hypothetical protein
MAKFVLLYTGGGAPESDEEGAAVIKAWTDWFTGLGESVVDPGDPFSPMVKTIASSGSVSEGPPGVLATGYSIINAGSLDEAVQKAKGCPHLMSGGQVTVYETYAVM